MGSFPNVCRTLRSRACACAGRGEGEWADGCQLATPLCSDSIVLHVKEPIGDIGDDLLRSGDKQRSPFRYTYQERVHHPDVRLADRTYVPPYPS